MPDKCLNLDLVTSADVSAGEFKDLRDNSQPCPCRGKNTEVISDWQAMNDGSIEEGGAVVRSKLT